MQRRMSNAPRRMAKLFDENNVGHERCDVRVMLRELSVCVLKKDECGSSLLSANLIAGHDAN